MQAFSKTLSAELIKVKNTPALWLIVISSAFLPVMQLLSYVHTDGVNIRLQPGENPWDSFSKNSFAMCSVFIIPMFVVLLVCLLLNIEHKSNAWKHLFVLPVSKEQLFGGKYFLALGMLLSFYVIFVSLMLLDGWILTSWIKEANPNHLPVVWYQIGKLTIQSIISTLPILAIHFWLSFRIKNLITNIGIGLAGIITGIVLASPGTWDKVFFFPYSYPALLAYRLNPNYHYSEYPVSSYALVYFFIISVLCYLDFYKKFRG